MWKKKKREISKKKNNYLIHFKNSTIEFWNINFFKKKIYILNKDKFFLSFFTIYAISKYSKRLKIKLNGYKNN
jgi:hypothetical protein